jgi:hypothetical protein
MLVAMATIRKGLITGNQQTFVDRTRDARAPYSTSTATTRRGRPVDPDDQQKTTETTAERYGPASRAAGGDGTPLGPRGGQVLPARAAAPTGRPRTGGDGRATLEFDGSARDPSARDLSARDPSTRDLSARDPSASGWPNIADYWPDAPQRMGPSADLEEAPGAAPTRVGVAWQERGVRAGLAGPPVGSATPHRRGRILAGGGLAVLLLLGGGVVAYERMAKESPLEGPPPAARPTIGPSPGPSGRAGPAVVLPTPSPSKTSAAPHSRPPASKAPALPAKGTFVLADDVSDLTVGTARLDKGIVKVSVPDGSDARPRTTVDGGRVELGVRDDADNPDVDVLLDSRVSWSIRFGGGARRMSVDLSGTEVRSVAFDRGVARIDLRLPPLDHTLPISLGGGVNQWRIVTDGRVGVRVTARRGAGDVELYGRDRGGLDRGDRVSADGDDGIDVDAEVGFGTLTVAGA